MTEANKEKALIPSWCDVYPREDFDHVFVIGLAGLAGSGKTTVAEQIVADLNRDERMPAGLRLSFAYRLKRILATLVGEESMTFTDPEGKTARLWGGSDWDVRKFMTTFATEFCRDQIGANLWVDIIAKQIHHLTEPTVVVIDDLRFPNEAKLVRSLGMAVLLRRSELRKTIEHSSEEPDKLAIETVIDNDQKATPQQLSRVIIDMAQKHNLWLPPGKTK